MSYWLLLALAYDIHRLAFQTLKWLLLGVTHTSAVTAKRWFEKCRSRLIAQRLLLCSFPVDSSYVCERSWTTCRTRPSKWRMNRNIPDGGWNTFGRQILCDTAVSYAWTKAHFDDQTRIEWFSIGQERSETNPVPSGVCILYYCTWRSRSGNVLAPCNLLECPFGKLAMDGPITHRRYSFPPRPVCCSTLSGPSRPPPSFGVSYHVDVIEYQCLFDPEIRIVRHVRVYGSRTRQA